MSQVSFKEETTAGSYSFPTTLPIRSGIPSTSAKAHEVAGPPPRPDAPLGIYVHIPFCRKRCHFCYFKVYTDKDSHEIDRYLDAVVRELTLYSGKAVHRRPDARLSFISAAARHRFSPPGSSAGSWTR